MFELFQILDMSIDVFLLLTFLQIVPLMLVKLVFNGVMLYIVYRCYRYFKLKSLFGTPKIDSWKPDAGNFFNEAKTFKTKKVKELLFKKFTDKFSDTPSNTTGLY